MLEVYFNESDWHYSKKVMRATKVTNEPIVMFDKRNQCLLLSILPRYHPILNEVRKRGVISDRPKLLDDLQLRVGDVLVIYNTCSLSREIQNL